jgi:hypothetical protein
MPGQAHDTTSKPVISAIAAELFVADIKASCDFFSQKLGFSIVFTYGEPPFYAQVKRDRALLNLKCVDYPVIDPALRDRESLLSADMAVIRAKRSSSCSWNFKRRASPSFRRIAVPGSPLVELSQQRQRLVRPIQYPLFPKFGAGKTMGRCVAKNFRRSMWLAM